MSRLNKFHKWALAWFALSVFHELRGASGQTALLAGVVFLASGMVVDAIREGRP